MIISSLLLSRRRVEQRNRARNASPLASGSPPERRQKRVTSLLRSLPTLFVVCGFLLMLFTAQKYGLNSLNRTEDNKATNITTMTTTTTGVSNLREDSNLIFGGIRTELDRARKAEEGSKKEDDDFYDDFNDEGDNNEEGGDGGTDGNVGDDDLGPDHKTRIAYAISLTGCGDGPTPVGLIDGAAILAHSIRSVSYPMLSSSRYSAKLFAIVHHDALKCSKDLQRLGYSILPVPTPIQIENIKGQFLREHVNKTGCCGEKEFIKLYAYTLADYPVAVHLDLDVLMLSPMDDLFDVIIAGEGGKAILHKKMTEGAIQVHKGPYAETYEPESSGRVDAFFTRDYNMVNPGKRYVGVQGGFLILRPDISALEQYVKVIHEGNFKQGSGWGGKFGGFYGAQQFQGVVPYFYDSLRPNTAVELNRCYYNNMADAPQGDNGKCRDSKEECQDCRETPVDEVQSAHFTICQKPWLCLAHDSTHGHHPICRKLHGIWYQKRKELEDLWVQTLGDVYVPPQRTGTYHKSHFLGFCNTPGVKGYTDIVVPGN